MVSLAASRHNKYYYYNSFPDYKCALIADSLSHAHKYNAQISVFSSAWAQLVKLQQVSF